MVFRRGPLIDTRLKINKKLLKAMKKKAVEDFTSTAFFFQGRRLGETFRLRGPSLTHDSNFPILLPQDSGSSSLILRIFAHFKMICYTLDIITVEDLK